MTTDYMQIQPRCSELTNLAGHIILQDQTICNGPRNYSVMRVSLLSLIDKIKQQYVHACSMFDSRQLVAMGAWVEWTSHNCTPGIKPLRIVFERYVIYVHVQCQHSKTHLGICSSCHQITFPYPGEKWNSNCQFTQD